MKETAQEKKSGEQAAPDVSKSYRNQAAFELIRFDKKAKIYVGVCLFFFLLFVVLKLHNSSIPLWNLNINDGASENRGLIAGKPLPVRSDEWLVASSFI